MWKLIKTWEKFDFVTGKFTKLDEIEEDRDFVPF